MTDEDMSTHSVEMGSGERVRRAIEFQKPDRAPISHAVLPAAQLQFGPALNAILAEFRDDFGWDGMEDLSTENYPALYKEGCQPDDFGTIWRVERMGICGIPIQWPIARSESLRRVSLAGRLRGWPAHWPPILRSSVWLR